MNPRMWAHPATQANAATLRARGVELVGPEEGEMAEGELGVGRMSEPEEIVARVQELLSAPGQARGMAGRAFAREARARHRRRNPRAARRRALRRQPLVAGAWASRSQRRLDAAAPT